MTVRVAADSGKVFRRDDAPLRTMAVEAITDIVMTTIGRAGTAIPTALRGGQIGITILRRGHSSDGKTAEATAMIDDGIETIVIRTATEIRGADRSFRS
jgi:hypothetical protein